MKIELFNKMSSCYFSTVYHILKEAANKELTDTELHKLILQTSEHYGYQGTTNFIIGTAIDAGKNEELDDNKDAWPFFDKDEEISKNINRFNHISDIPLSKYEKMWLKSIYSDPRVKLFLEDNVELPDLKDVELLFDWNDFVLFDKYSNGDSYQDEHYIKIFRSVLKAVNKKHTYLEIKFKKSNNGVNFKQDGNYELVPNQEIGTLYIEPEYLEYSERDDKFRLIGNSPKYGRTTVNISSIISCEEVELTENDDFQEYYSNEDFQKKAVFELIDDKNALERFLMNFSHYEKETEYQKDKKQYRISVFYDEADEKDVVIRVLSFGPYVKAVEPESFVKRISSKLQMQIKLRNTLGTS